jgi:hypothetical protein
LGGGSVIGDASTYDSFVVFDADKPAVLKFVNCFK